MIAPIDGLPQGVTGLRSAGKLTREDYTGVLEPALKQAIEAGGVRLLFVIEELEGAEPGAWLEDMKTGLGAWIEHRSAWERFALVTDVEWIARAVRMFDWMAPGEVRVFGLADQGEARSWVAG